MEDWVTNVLDKFIIEARKGELKTASYPKELNDLKMKVSFGMGVPARVPWIAFTAPEMQVSKGFYPVFLYYRALDTLVLAYGISETEEFSSTWPFEITNSTITIRSLLGEVPRYGDSFVFKTFEVSVKDEHVTYIYRETGNEATAKDIEVDLSTILDSYKRIVSIEITKTDSPIS